MIVYLVEFQSTYEDHCVVAAFSTRELAEEYIRRQGTRGERYMGIDEMEVDSEVISYQRYPL